MTFNDFKNHLITAASNGTLLTPKHDPNNLGTTVFSSFRTVLSHDLAANLDTFITSGKYTVSEYENKKLPNSPLYFEITPNQDSGFSVPASGVTANSVFASTVVDKIIAVSGQTQGWHLFGEDSSIIQRKANNGDILYKNILT
jgi:hypothetical protein